MPISQNAFLDPLLCQELTFWWLSHREALVGTGRVMVAVEGRAGVAVIYQRYRSISIVS